MTLNKTQRAELRMMFGGKCSYCGCELPEKGWHADHVKAVRREWWKTQSWYAKTYGPQKPSMEYPENDTQDNLFPACASCNIDKRDFSLESWRKQLEDKVGVCRRNYNAFSHAERFGLIQVTEHPIVFWFEKYGYST